MLVFTMKGEWCVVMGATGRVEQNEKGLGISKALSGEGEEMRRSATKRALDQQTQGTAYQGTGHAIG